MSISLPEDMENRLQRTLRLIRAPGRTEFALTDHECLDLLRAAMRSAIATGMHMGSARKVSACV
jgi:hypothetical protein